MPWRAGERTPVAGLEAAEHLARNADLVTVVSKEALQKVRDGFPGRETLTALREEVDGLKEQNRGLRERIEKLEGLLPERKGGGA